MNETRQVLERARRLAPSLDDPLERLVRYRQRRQRNQRLAAGIVAVALFAGASIGLALALLREGSPTPAGPAPDAAGPPVVVDKISFLANDAIWVVSPDGTGLQRLVGGGGLPRGFPGLCCLSWSPDGTRVALSGGGDRSGDIYTLNADGTDLMRLTRSEDNDHSPVWSPDGARIAFIREENRFIGGGVRDGVYAINADGTELRRVRSEAEPLSNLSWSADGTAIVFFGIRTSFPGREWGLYSVDVEGGKTRLLSPRSPTLVALREAIALSPDGARIAFSRIVNDECLTDEQVECNTEIFVASVDGSDVVRVTNDPAFDQWPTWSPDGSRIAFVSGRDAHAGRIYVMNADGSRVTRLPGRVNMDRGEFYSGPVWTPVG